MEVPSMDCPLCNASRVVLAETPNYLLLANLEPPVAGSLLIITREHQVSMGRAPYPPALQKLIALGKSFLLESYDSDAFEWENFGTGSVLHAHLQLLPVPINTRPPEKPAGALEAKDPIWPNVGHRFGFQGHSWIFEAESPALKDIRRYMASSMGISLQEDGIKWVRPPFGNKVSKLRTSFGNYLKEVERETGFEPATSSLEG